MPETWFHNQRGSTRRDDRAMMMPGSAGRSELFVHESPDLPNQRARGHAAQKIGKDNMNIGTDIVEISRIAEALERHGEQFKKRLLTEAEIALASTRKDAVTFYAGRWAAKEAVAKALGCGIGEHCSFTDIEILNDPAGAPQVNLYNAALETLKKSGNSKIMCSISHERSYAVAMAVITG